MKLGIKNGSLEKALLQIDSDLTQFEKLLDASEREAPLEQDRKRRGNAKVWTNMRVAARHMYNALAAHWQCSPDHHHVASLKLENRKVETCTISRFSVVTSWHSGTQQPIWNELEIEPKATNASIQAPLISHKSTQAKAGSGGFRVSFMAVAPSVTITNAQPTATTITKALQIHDFCKWQPPQKPQHDCQGFLEHQSWHHHVFESKTTHQKPSTLSLLPLQDCVTGNAPSGSVAPMFSRGLLTREKYHLATILASSVLQLADTPWLPDSSYALQQIFLMDLQQRHLTTASPYLQHRFPDPVTNQPTSTCALIDNELVFAFGVILIELAYGQPLSTFKLATDRDPQGNDYPHTNFQIALRLVKDLRKMEGEKYAQAAWRCVKCNFEARERSLDNADFQEQFYQGVVLPLQELRDALG